MDWPKILDSGPYKTLDQVSILPNIGLHITDLVLDISLKNAQKRAMLNSFLHIKPEMHHISFLHYVFLAF